VFVLGLEGLPDRHPAGHGDERATSLASVNYISPSR
jgi:hypothetical protein